MIDYYIKFVHMKTALGYRYDCIGVQILLHRGTDITA